MTPTADGTGSAAASAAAAHPLGGAAASRSPAAIGHAAALSLYQELALYPKPGLVSFVDSGSHADMDASTFMGSVFALRPYFAQIATLGARGAGFGELERAGIAAEARMLQATGGVNTHRGAIFVLGLLCAAAGRVAASGTSLSPRAIRAALRAAWGSALAGRCQTLGDSHGQRAARLHGLGHAGAEAAGGFPVLFETTLPALQRSLARGEAPVLARLDALMRTVAVLADTNLAHRGGMAGLRFAQGAAARFLAAGGVGRADAVRELEGLHRQFVARRLSPGGAADLLAGACWLQRVCE
ncbi:MAG TPA: triphosphoribosyl-dephospho-CoA synthase MdcB [Planctomycetota bacterium]|nr:triphosphoribosyl-dephospho-CoA synthase MdcB [Planctomycetota bacterium]